jgi:aryl-alcohol dehydrogenase-like predicted oxidoreductase
MIPSRNDFEEELTIGTDLSVRRLGFGSMRLPGRGVWGQPQDASAARAVLRRAVELGVNFIDTADSYGPEVSEQLIAEALHPYSAELVIATKGGFQRPGPGRWRPDGRPEHLREACEGSLRRLRLEQIDLYQLHTVDPRIPIEESVGALAELQRAGKIRYVGLSNVSVDQIERARPIVPVVSVQNRYSLVDQVAEAVLHHCAQEGIAFICWSPLERGLLGRGPNALARISGELHATPSQVALAWLLHRSALTVPIPGTSSIEHLEENTHAQGVRLTPEELHVLAEYRLGGMMNLRRAARRNVRGLMTALRHVAPIQR